jgi:hypothetical protein
VIRVAALLLVLAPAASALPDPSTGGTPAGQPAAPLGGLVVQRQALDLDLRPLARPGLQTAILESTFLVANPTSAPLPFPLTLFARTDIERSAEVWLDGGEVVGAWSDRQAVPPLWAGIRETPALGGAPAPYEVHTGTGAAPAARFDLSVPPGLHQVRTRQHVRVGAWDDGQHPNRIWQVGYSLAASRLWPGFGQLDVTVRVPGGWEAAASLPLRADGDALVGRFQGVPGDVLAVSARAPLPAGRVPLRLASYGAALLICALAGWVGGRLLRQSGRRTAWALPLSFLGGVLAAVALVALRGIADDLGDSSSFALRSVTSGVMVVGPVTALVGTVLAQSLAARLARRA